jgi:hypothetical protein
MGVYKGIAQDNVTINGGTLYNVTLSAPTVTDATITGTVTGNVDATAGYVQLRTATAVQIGAIGNAVNTAGKAAGTIVFDTTNSKLKIATGATAASTWVDADGTNAVTPA